MALINGYMYDVFVFLSAPGASVLLLYVDPKLAGLSGKVASSPFFHTDFIQWGKMIKLLTTTDDQTM